MNSERVAVKKLFWLSINPRYQKLFLPFLGLLFSIDAHADAKQDFVTRMGAKSVTLVFTSYYLGNPSSTFGHTFLRLNRKPHSQDDKNATGYDLHDYGVGFGAAVTTSNAILYAVYGLTGGFRTELSVLPYYYKIREYSDAEARDLWEYDLNLSSDEVERLVGILWELGQSDFRYYYLSKNCSYFVLAALDAAAPQLRLVERLKGFVIPADTVHLISETPDLVKRVHYRPSVRHQFSERARRLDPEEKKELQIWCRHIDSGEKIPTNAHEFKSFYRRSPASQAKILDAALDYTDQRFFKDLVIKKERESRIQHQLLTQRSLIAHTSEPLSGKVPESQRPDQGHYSSRFTLASGYSNTSGMLGSFQLRLALHDLTDSIGGYPGYAQIELADLRLRWQRNANLFGSSRFSLDRFTLFQGTTLSPWNSFSYPVSWKLRLGTSQPQDGVCGNCQAAELNAGAGITLPLQFDFESELEKPRSLFAFLEGGPQLSPSFKGSKTRLLFGPSLGVRWAFTPRWLALLTARRPWILGNSSPDGLHTNHFIQTELETRWTFHRRLAAYAQASYFDFENGNRKNSLETFVGLSWYW